MSEEIAAKRAMAESVSLSKEELPVVGELYGIELPVGEVVEGLEVAVVEQDHQTLFEFLQVGLGFLVEPDDFYIVQVNLDSLCIHTLKLLLNLFQNTHLDLYYVIINLLSFWGPFFPP